MLTVYFYSKNNDYTDNNQTNTPTIFKTGLNLWKDESTKDATLKQSEKFEKLKTFEKSEQSFRSEKPLMSEKSFKSEIPLKSGNSEKSLKLEINRSDMNSCSDAVENETKSRDSIDNLIENIKSRKRYNYTYRDLCYNAFCCCKCNSKSNSMTMYRRFQLYKQAADRITEEFDAIKFAKTQRKLNAMMDLLLSKDQKFITEFDYTHTIGGLQNNQTSEVSEELPLLITTSSTKVSKSKSSLHELFKKIRKIQLSKNKMNSISIDIEKDKPKSIQNEDELEDSVDPVDSIKIPSHEESKSNLLQDQDDPLYVEDEIPEVSVDEYSEDFPKVLDENPDEFADAYPKDFENGYAENLPNQN